MELIESQQNSGSTVGALLGLGPDPGELRADRRLFYVALTRARHQIHLVYSTSMPHPKPRLHG
jgi:superfamily I DNA/RNA helicase